MRMARLKAAKAGSRGKKKQRVSTPDKRFRIVGRNPVFMSGVKVVEEDGATSFGTGPCFTLVFQLKGRLMREKGPRGVRRRREKPTTVVWHVTSSHASEGTGQVDGRDDVVRLLRKKGQLLGFQTEGFHPKTVSDGILDYLYGKGGKNARIVVTAIPGRVTLEGRKYAEAMGGMMELLRKYKDEGRIHNLHTRGLSKFKGSLSVHVDGRGRINRDVMGPPKLKLKKDGQT